MTRPTLILGADPGASGALAFLFVDRATGDVEGLRFEDMPTLEVRKGRKTQTVLNEAGLALLVRRYGQIDAAYVEDVHAMPGQGVVSMFKFGYATGVLRGVLAACDIPTHPVTPQEWKRAVRVPTGADKDEGRRRAIQLFPQTAGDLARKKDQGRADAALIAWAGWLRT